MRSSLALLIFLPALLLAQAPRDTSLVAAGYLLVESNAASAYVLVDGVRVAKQPGRIVSVDAGTRVVRLEPALVDQWNGSNPEETVSVQPGDTLTLRLNVPYGYRIDSMPQGANVYATTEDGRVHLGETPLVLHRTQPFDQPLSIEKPGFEAGELATGATDWNTHTVLLNPLEVTTTVDPELRLVRPQRNSRLVELAAAGLALGAGIVSIHYKFKADELYREYEDTGDPSVRSEIERFDRISGVALGTAQVSFGVLAFRLILR
ncbi:MAG: hypothetical protein AAGI08_11605 [Bacteroidota bacterium]